MNKIIEFSKIILRGVSKIMLQNNSITGLLFLIGIFYNSWLMGLGALLGVLASTLTARILNYKKEDIHSGDYGFNGALVGIALIYFFDVNYLLIIALILGAILSTLIMGYMLSRKWSPYTFPFVLSAWIFMIIIKFFNLVPQHSQDIAQAVNLDIASSLSMGFGQVMLQASIVTGIIFFIAILINSKSAAVYGLIGSLIGMLIALGLSFPLNLVNIGIFGFNGVLCGIAFAGKRKYSLIFAFIAIAMSVFIIHGMVTFNLIALTAPFVFATWITLVLRKLAQLKYPQL